jgi:hypothetical protein
MSGGAVPSFWDSLVSRVLVVWAVLDESLLVISALLI